MIRNPASTFFLALVLAGCGGASQMASETTPTQSAAEPAPVPAPPAETTPPPTPPTATRLNLKFHVPTLAGWTIYGQDALQHGSVVNGLQFVAKNPSLSAEMSVYAIRTEGTAADLINSMHDSFVKKGTMVGEVESGSTGACFPYQANETTGGIICARVYDAKGVTLTFVGRWPDANAMQATPNYFEMASNLRLE